MLDIKHFDLNFNFYLNLNTYYIKYLRNFRKEKIKIKIQFFFLQFNNNY